MTGAGTVRVLRGERLESQHRFAWRLHEPGGAGRGGGEPGPVFVRSAAKPFQALPAVRAGALERFGLDDRHLAIGCASHGGGPEHLARVAEILAACGLGEDALACGPLPPRDPRAAEALDGPPRRIHHNCSGKHALGLALCVAEGWPADGYLEAAHPLQRAMRAAILEATGTPAGAVGEAVDGCGMRTYAVALEDLAAAFGRLAAGRLGGADGGGGDAGAGDDGGGDAGGDDDGGGSDDDGDGAARVAGAMAAHPALVGYAGAVDTELMAAAGGGAVAKAGAEAVLAIGTRDGRGLAIKVLDGAARALDPAAVLCARELLGLPAGTPALRALAAPEIRNSRGEPVGRLEAALA